MAQSKPEFIIKICGITNIEDAQMAVSAGANALGFNFYTQSPRHSTPNKAREVARAVEGSYLRVGVFVNATEDELLSVASKVPLDVLQLHGDACAIPITRSYRIWQSAPGGTNIPAVNDRIEAYLLDSVTPHFGGSGKTFDWSRAAGFPFRMIVAGGLDGNNVAQAIGTMQPWGVDACSRIESYPGKKDSALTRGFINAALEASERLNAQEVSYL